MVRWLQTYSTLPRAVNVSYFKKVTSEFLCPYVYFHCKEHAVNCTITVSYSYNYNNNKHLQIDIGVMTLYDARRLLLIVIICYMHF